MSYTITKITDYKLWDEFLKTHELAQIQQTSTWGEFQKKVPSRGKFAIIALLQNGKIVGGTMLIHHKLFRGYCWLYSARGPLLDYSNPQTLNNQLHILTRAIQEYAVENRAVFWRIDPHIKVYKDGKNLSLPFKTPFKGFRFSHGFHPEFTQILDLTLSEKELLEGMKPKGRYNIKLAEKKGITVRISDPQDTVQFQKDINTYYQILKETTRRDGFYGHKKSFYHDMITTLGSKNAKLYIAEYNNEPLSACITTYFKKTATYYYGVSSNINRNLMAPYLMQWQAIKDAKEVGYTEYDFLGIAPPLTHRKGKTSHVWDGITDFKKKFGGSEVGFLFAQEKALKPLIYWIYRLYKGFK